MEPRRSATSTGSTTGASTTRSLTTPATSPPAEFEAIYYIKAGAVHLQPRRQPREDASSTTVRPIISSTGRPSTRSTSMPAACSAGCVTEREPHRPTRPGQAHYGTVGTLDAPARWLRARSPAPKRAMMSRCERLPTFQTTCDRSSSMAGRPGVPATMSPPDRCSRTSWREPVPMAAASQRLPRCTSSATSRSTNVATRGCVACTAKR